MSTAFTPAGTAEAAAVEAGRTLLVLDTAAGGAGEGLYRRLGWVAIGTIPRFALHPDGRPCGSTFFYRDLALNRGLDRGA